MTFESSKTFGGIGAFLVFIAFLSAFIFSYVGLVIGLVGVILVLVGLRGLGNYYHERNIFTNAMYGFAALIIGLITAVGVLIATILMNLDNLKAFLMQIYPGWNGDWSSLQNLTPDTNALSSSNFDFSIIIAFVIGILGFIVVIWIFAIIASFFVRRSLNKVTEKSTIGLFGTAGLVMLIGAVLTIVLIGVFLVWVGALLLGIAFFQLRPSEPIVVTPMSPPPQVTA
jgi:uncharacterized membrane protein